MVTGLGRDLLGVPGVYPIHLTQSPAEVALHGQCST